MSDAARYVRQMMLPEIGEAGQAKLSRAVVALGGEDLCHEIATSYAERAGVSRVIPGHIDEAALSPAYVHGPGARAVVAGSRAALQSLRALLDA